MNKRIFLIVGTSATYAVLNPLAALSESECFSMAGNYDEGAHSSFALNRLDGPSLYGINSQSGGVFGTGASSMTNGPSAVPQNTESGGTMMSGAETKTGGPLQDLSQSNSNLHQIWTPDDYARNGAGSRTQNKQVSNVQVPAPVAARVPVMRVTTYHWNERPRDNSRYAYRSGRTI